MNREARKILLGLAYVLIGLFRKPLSGFATGLECMDGRVQGALRKKAKRKYRVKYVDIITQPGINKILAENTDVPIIENIKKMLWISINDHGSRTIIIAAHHNCAGNPNNKETQLAHLREAEKTVRNMLENLPLGDLGLSPMDFVIDLLWINEKWMPEEIPSDKWLVKMNA